ncbi:MAG: lysostaphin resistance A-like protein [Phycisphaerae bacterium]
MADRYGPVEFESGPGRVRRASVSDIPVARPIAATPSATGLRCDHPFLLGSAQRSRVWADVALVAFAVVTLDVVVGTVLHMLAFPSDALADIPEPAVKHALFAPMLASRVIVIALSVTAILWCRGQTLASIGLVSSGVVVDVLVGVAATAVAYALSFSWQLLVWTVWPGLLDQMSENAQRIMRLVPNPGSPVRFVPVALAVGVYEELLFRGFLMTRLRRGMGSWAGAVIVSTGVFTALHGVDQTAAALIPVAILSSVFSLTTIWRRSLLPAVVGHSLFNLISFLVLYFTAESNWV